MQVLDPKKKANEDATKAVKDRNKLFVRHYLLASDAFECRPTESPSRETTKETTRETSAEPRHYHPPCQCCVRIGVDPNHQRDAKKELKIKIE